jgi:hypothetical protein
MGAARDPQPRKSMPEVSSEISPAHHAPLTIQKLLYDRKSAAFALSISIRSLDYLISLKKINTIRLGSKIMIGHSELVKFSRANHPTLTEMHTSTAVQ